MDATVASASPQRAETARITSSRESATVVLLTESTRRYRARIAPTARTETRKRESFMHGMLRPLPDPAMPVPNKRKGSTQRALAMDVLPGGMGFETREECAEGRWNHSLKGRSTGGPRREEKKSPSFARIGRLKPAPPRMGFRREEDWSSEASSGDSTRHAGVRAPRW